MRQYLLSTKLGRGNNQQVCSAFSFKAIVSFDACAVCAKTNNLKDEPGLLSIFPLLTNKQQKIGKEKFENMCLLTRYFVVTLVIPLSHYSSF